MRHTIWDVHEYGTIVLADEERAMLITYNGSQTFNVWEESTPGFYRNTDVFTVNNVMDIRDARECAVNWLDDFALREE